MFYLPKNHFSNEINDKLIRIKNRFIWVSLKTEQLCSKLFHSRDRKSGDDFEKKSFPVSFRLSYFITLWSWSNKIMRSWDSHGPEPKNKIPAYNLTCNLELANQIESVKFYAGILLIGSCPEARAVLWDNCLRAICSSWPLPLCVRV